MGWVIDEIVGGVRVRGWFPTLPPLDEQRGGGWVRSYHNWVLTLRDIRCILEWGEGTGGTGRDRVRPSPGGAAGRAARGSSFTSGTQGRITGDRGL